jgi:hypothetical protein
MKWGHALGALAAVVAATALGTSWVRYDVARAVRECPKICVGTVVERHAERLATQAFGADGICTEVTVHVDRGLKGFDAPASDTFSFWVPGGVVDGDARDVPGAPAFQVGDRALVFFFESEGRYWPLWGGVAPIVRGTVVGQKGHTIEESRHLADLEPEIARLATEGRR